MELMLKKLRKSLTPYTQAQMAELVGVKARTYESWERNQAMLNLAQACTCADVLGCTVDEIAGRPAPREYADKRQGAINGYYESMAEEGRAALLRVAQGMGKDASNRIEKSGAEALEDTQSASA